MFTGASWDSGIHLHDATEMAFDIANLVYNVTNELGKDRTERALRTYPKIRTDDDAVFVKGMDRMANTKHSKKTGSSMHKKYLKEYPIFRYSLRTRNIHTAVWDELDAIHEYKEN